MIGIRLCDVYLTKLLKPIRRKPYQSADNFVLSKIALHDFYCYKLIFYFLTLVSSIYSRLFGAMLSGIFCLSVVRGEHTRRRRNLMVRLTNGADRQLLNSSIDDEEEEEDEIP